MYRSGKDIVEQVIYPSGGTLEIYANGTRSYIPSETYRKKVEKANRCIVTSSPKDKTRIAIKHNRNKLLFNKGVCITGNRLIDKVFQGPTPKFNFTKVKTK